MKKIILSENQVSRLFESENNGVIRLYHGTTFDALEWILYDGVISASNGKQHGETRGVNWFSTNYSTNFSKGVVFSIEATQEEFDQRLFRYMNRTEVTSDGEYRKEIPIEGRNFRIEKFGSISSTYDFDVLKNILEMTNEDIFETVERIDRLNSRNSSYAPLNSVDNPIFIMLMKQIGRTDLLEKEGVI